MRKRNRRAGRSSPALVQAIDKVERAASDMKSKQPRFTNADAPSIFTSMYKWVKTELSVEPAYSVDSRARDRWLSEVWRKEPHIAGVTSSVVSINANRGWWIAGGRNQVARYNRILRRVEGGAGWRQYMSQSALSYYSTDMGAISEIGREGGPDGPLRDLFFVDSARCYLTGKSNKPLAYRAATNNREQEWLPTDFFRVAALPSSDEAHRGLGFCALSRAIQLIMLMVAIYEHDKEVLGAKAPRGLLLLQNVSEQQWVSAMSARAANLTQMERDYYGGVAVLAQEGVDQMDAKLVALSQLPANFDLETFTNLLMYGVALTYNYDPTEFWPVNAGVMGRGLETQIQHTKATGKGGLEFILSYQDQLQQELPPTIEFQFEQRDAQGELIDASVKKAFADVGDVLFRDGRGPLSLDEVRVFLADAGVIPPEWTVKPDESLASSSGEISGEDDEIEVKADDKEPTTEPVARSLSANNETLWAAAFQSPYEPLVRMNQAGQVQYLSHSGFDFIRRNRTHPIARSMAIEHGWYNPTMARDLFGHSFQVLQPLQLETRAAKILFSDDDVTITEKDVDKAITQGSERVGVEFAELLRAE